MAKINRKKEDKMKITEVNFGPMFNASTDKHPVIVPTGKVTISDCYDEKEPRPYGRFLVNVHVNVGRDYRVIQITEKNYANPIIVGGIDCTPYLNGA
jgi:hypothetical protein